MPRLFSPVPRCWPAGAGLQRAARGRRTAPAAPITVQVSYPIQKEVTDYVDSPGGRSPWNRSRCGRVWGYLTKVNFKEGALVQKGDVLVELDSRPYQAEYARAHSDFALA